MLVPLEAFCQIRGSATVLFGIARRLHVDVVDSGLGEFGTENVLAEAPLVAPRRLTHVGNDPDAHRLQFLNIRADIHTLIAKRVKVQFEKVTGTLRAWVFGFQYVSKQVGHWIVYIVVQESRCLLPTRFANSCSFSSSGPKLRHTGFPARPYQYAALP